MSNGVLIYELWGMSYASLPFPSLGSSLAASIPLTTKTPEDPRIQAGEQPGSLVDYRMLPCWAYDPVGCSHELAFTPQQSPKPCEECTCP